MLMKGKGIKKECKRNEKGQERKGKERKGEESGIPLVSIKKHLNITALIEVFQEDLVALASAPLCELMRTITMRVVVRHLRLM